MSLRTKFLNDFEFISKKFSYNIALYWVSDLKKTLGVTYFEFNRLSNELSHYFLKIFEGDSKYIGVSLSDYFLLPCIILAIWKSNNFFVGIKNQYELKCTLKHLNALKVQYFITESEKFYDGNIISHFHIQEQKFFIWYRGIQCKKEKLFNVENICYGITTSGSTGISKTIQVPWSSILPNVIELSDEFQISESDCIFQASPCTFDPFFVELFLTLINGSSLMIVPNFIKLCPTNLLKILFEADNSDETLPLPSSNIFEKENHFLLKAHQVKRKNITLLQMTPSVFKRWNDEEIKNYILASKTSLRILLLGGEKFPSEVLKLKHSDNKTRIFNIYGITEISCWAFLNEVTNQPYNLNVSIGKPLNNIIYKISEDNEFYIGSQSRKCLVDEEYSFQVGNPVFRNSGDIVKLNNNELYYIGRCNQTVKKYGIKINLVKIEQLFLNLNKSMKECNCIFDEANIKLGLFYVPSTKKALKENFLLITYEDFLEKGYCFPKKELKDIEKPDYLIEISEIPLNSHGKCNRKKLEQYLACFKKPKKFELNLEKTFLKIWNEVLGLEKSNLNTNAFTDLGGNSILALELINKLEDVGLKVPQNFIAELLGGGSFQTCLNCLTLSIKTSETPKKKIKFEKQSLSNDDIKVFLKWKFDLEKCVDAIPTVFSYKSGERIIVGSHSSKLSCLDVDSGCEIWSIFLGDRIESGFTVTKDGTRGFVGCYDNFVYGISIFDGSIIWKYKTEEMIKSTPCLSSDEKILYVGSYDKYLHCLSTKNGQLKNKIRLSNGGIFCSGIVSTIYNTFYLATLDGTCIALEQEKNQIKWQNKLETPVFATPCLLSQETEILFAEVLGIIHCFNAVSGAKIWSYKASGNIYSSPIIYILNKINFILFGCHDCHVYCLQYEKVPELKWKQQLDSSVFARPAIIWESTSNIWCLCATTTTGFIYFCDFNSGLIKTRIKLNGEIFSSPVFRKQHLFIGCRDDNIYCFDIVKTKC